MRAAEDKQYLAYCRKVVKKTRAQTALERKRLPLWIGASLLSTAVLVIAFLNFFSPHSAGIWGWILLVSMGAVPCSLAYAIICLEAFRSHANCDEIVAQRTLSYKEWLQQQAEKAEIAMLPAERQEVAVSICS